MIRMLSKHTVAGLVLLFLASALLGCDSQDLGTPAETETPDDSEARRIPREISESCAVCHAAGKIGDVGAVHQASQGSVRTEIDGVTVSENQGEVRMAVAFRVSEDGIPLAGMAASEFRFTVARLEEGAEGRSRGWQSYVNQRAVKEEGDPGTAPHGTDLVQATYERANAEGGVFEDHGDGSYSYVFSFDFSKVTEPVSVPYDASLTHRVALQVGDNIGNPVYDFRPWDGATQGIATQDIAMTASCNECHGRLAIHGSGRVELRYCVSCHNPGSTDPNSGNSVSMEVMIHKIHRGENLPSVEAGGEYAIWGYRDSKHDYSHVAYPQDIRNCAKCHDGADEETPDGDNWKTSPSIAACGSCHDNISFVSPPPPGMVLHSDGPREDSAKCAECHSPTYIARAHEIPEVLAAEAFRFEIVKIENTSPEAFPVVTFSVRNPSDGDAPYNILADKEFTAGGGVSRLAIIIGWDTADYTNTGSQRTPGQPVSVNPLTDARDNGDGTFSVTSPVSIPSDAVGTGTVALEGHPAADPDGDGIYDLRVPVRNVFMDFLITDSDAVPRRDVVDIGKCNQCHGNLSLHGNNRTGEIRVCVICHNPDATDINRRPLDPESTADGKGEESIDFKRMIHGIHAANARDKGIVVYGYGGTEHDFGHVAYPGIIRRCETCHVEDTYALPLGENVRSSTIGTGRDLADPGDDTKITRASAVCSSCHDSELAATHMTQNGGDFTFSLYETPSDGQEEPDTTRGERNVEDQPPGHTTRTDCASCH